MCRRTRYFFQKLANKGNILLEQTAQALIRLLRYWGLQSQLTMHAICSFSLMLLSRNTGEVMSPEPPHKKTVLAKTNEVSPQAHSCSMIGTIVTFYIQGRYFYLSEQHGF